MKKGYGQLKHIGYERDEAGFSVFRAILEFVIGAPNISLDAIAGGEEVAMTTIHRNEVISEPPCSVLIRNAGFERNEDGNKAFRVTVDIRGQKPYLNIEDIEATWFTLTPKNARRAPR